MGPGCTFFGQIKKSPGGFPYTARRTLFDRKQREQTISRRTVLLSSKMRTLRRFGFQTLFV